MKLAYTRLVTNDLPRLATFYKELLATPSEGNDYVELRLGRAILAIVSKKACEFLYGGVWQAAANHSAIIDVDMERDRIDAIVTDWLLQPKDLPGVIPQCCSAIQTAIRLISISLSIKCPERV